MAQVLVVEDHDALRLAFCQFLAERGHSPIEAKTGTEALAEAASRSPSIAVIDLRLPDMDGLALFRLLRKPRPRLPAVIITGYGSIPSAVECLHSGVTEYLEKPVDFDDLIRIVESIESQGLVSASGRQLVVPNRRRMAMAIVRDLENQDALASFGAWAHAVYAAESTLRLWCDAAAIKPKHAFALRRGLAAIVLTGLTGATPEELLGLQDPRSVAAFVARYGPLRSGTRPLTPAEYCLGQRAVSDRALLDEVISLLKRSG